ncbi:hypothetical protein QCA50_019400 [Cerrena zonata]|uniref:F-box domain-containing protein n=1 Tax=Cerrena zonata TaxID=2478898 RepID=A0AAW0FHI3_9APHY
MKPLPSSTPLKSIKDKDKNFPQNQQVEYNGLCLALQLPYEIWAKIGECHRRVVLTDATEGERVNGRQICLYDYLTLTQVCTYIREILLSVPSLWTSIVSTPTTSTELINEFLRRSQPHNVQISLYINPNSLHTPRLNRYMQEVSLRVHRLVFEITPCCVEEDAKETQVVQVPGDVPALETIILRRSTGGYSADTLPYTLIGPSLPNVKRLYISNFSLDPLHFPTSDRLTVLRISNRDKGYPMILPREIMAILSRLKNLETLYLENTMVPIEIHNDELSLVTLPRLSSLYLRNHGLGTSRVLQHLIIPCDTNIQLRSRFVLDPYWVERSMLSISRVFRGRGFPNECPQAFGALVLYPSPNGLDIVVEGHVDVPPIEELLSSHRDAKLLFEFTNLSKMVDTLFRTLSYLPVSGLKTLCLADVLLSGIPREALEAAFNATPNLQTLTLVDWTSITTTPMEATIYFGPHGRNSYKDAVANVNCNAEFRAHLLTIFEASQHSRLAFLRLEMRYFNRRHYRLSRWSTRWMA